MLEIRFLILKKAIFSLMRFLSNLILSTYSHGMKQKTAIISALISFCIKKQCFILCLNYRFFMAACSIANPFLNLSIKTSNPSISALSACTCIPVSPANTFLFK